jgi:hypothetical protein
MAIDMMTRSVSIPTVPLRGPLLRLFHGDLGIDLATVATLTGQPLKFVQERASLWEVRKWRGRLRHLGQDTLREISVLAGNPHALSYFYEGRPSDWITLIREDIVSRGKRGELNWKAIVALATVLDTYDKIIRLEVRRTERSMNQAA